MGRCCRRGGRCRILQPLGGRKVLCSWGMDIGRRLLCWKRRFGQMSVEREISHWESGNGMMLVTR